MDACTSMPRCVRFRIRLAEGLPARWEVAGYLYLPQGEPSSTIQVLVPGMTYDHRYWTVPGKYDYTRHMVSAGYAVLALDRIGTGESSRPPAAEVTADAHAYVLHQVIQALRAGHDGVPAFSTVIAVGHSYGSGVAIVEAAKYADIDGLIVSGMLHVTSGLHAEARSFFHHAADDPVLGQLGVDWPEFYMTQRPGLRARMLEHSADMDAEISRYNEAIKSTATIGEGDTLQQTYDARYSRAVTVPVLIVAGEHDALFAGEGVHVVPESAAVREFEKDFYAPGADLEVHMIPRAGHSLNVHESATAWFAIALAWAERVAPARRLTPAPAPSA
jgi:pimeloyl-ACP methyl ester carboxylesterase